MLHQFEPIRSADMVFLEATYGDRDHRPFDETVEEFVRIVQEAVAARGRILIPTFAVGRAQLLTTLLSWMFRNGRVPPFPLFLDSPMAIEATKIYNRHPELYDEETQELIRQGVLRPDLPNLHTCATAEESKKLNDLSGPILIMAGSGMCNAGRILHHLRNHLWKPDTFVVIVGFQGAGTLGRMLVEGAKEVRIFGETVAVKAEIHTLNGFSAHAGQSDLLRWFHFMAPSKPRVVLTHGESKQRETLAGLIRQRYNIEAKLPVQGDTVSL